LKKKNGTKKRIELKQTKKRKIGREEKPPIQTLKQKKEQHVSTSDYNRANR
jgi:hypothetical protein